jgi:MFS family permease
MTKLKITILSLSLLTVMSGAAVAPALGEIALYFKDYPSILIKLIITLPSLFIILTSLIFTYISNKISSKSIAILGLFLYIIGGCGAGLTDNIYLLLISRAFLGIAVGLIMPLSTGLISYFFDKDEQSKLMGYSSSMNQLGGMIALALSGYLGSISWRYSFLIYLLGLIALVMVIRYLPNTENKIVKNKRNIHNIRKIAPYTLIMFLTMVVLYTFPTNFSFIIKNEDFIATSYIGLLMSIQGITSLVVGLLLTSILNKLNNYSKYFASAMFSFGFLSLSIPNNLITMIIGLIAIGIAIGIMIPLLFTQISFNSNKENITSLMAMMNIMLYLGQFLSPIIVDIVQSTFKLNSIYSPYYIASFISIIILISFKWIKVVTILKE